MPNSRRSDVFGLGNSFSIGLPSLGADALGDEIYYLPASLGTRRLIGPHTPVDGPRALNKDVTCRHRSTNGAQQTLRPSPVLDDHPAPRNDCWALGAPGAEVPEHHRDGNPRSCPLVVTRTAAMTSLLASNLRGLDRGGVPAR